MLPVRRDRDAEAGQPCGVARLAPDPAEGRAPERLSLRVDEDQTVRALLREGVEVALHLQQDHGRYGHHLLADIRPGVAADNTTTRVQLRRGQADPDSRCGEVAAMNSATADSATEAR